jgi:hypothetical protein
MNFKVFALCALLIMLLSMLMNEALSQDAKFLVGYWSFDSVKGNEAKDLSGNNNNGTINGNVKVVTGKFGDALSFDGSGSHVAVADSKSLDGMDKLTVQLWVNFNAITADWNHILEKDCLYGLTVNTAAGTFQYDTGTDCNNRAGWVDSKYKVAVKTWYHIAMTVDGSNVSFYVNGKKESEKAWIKPVGDSNAALHIAHPSSYLVNGIIDEVKVWSIALTESEIQREMTGGTSVKPKGKLTQTWASIKHTF